MLTCWFTIGHVKCYGRITVKPLQTFNDHQKCLFIDGLNTLSRRLWTSKHVPDVITPLLITLQWYFSNYRFVIVSNCLSVTSVMPKINLDRRIGFPIHSFMETPNHKTMRYYATWCWSKTSAVKITTISNSLALYFSTVNLVLVRTLQ